MCACTHTHARALATNTQSHVSVGREKAGNVTVVSPADCGNIPAIMKPLCTAMEQFIAASPLLAYDLSSQRWFSELEAIRPKAVQGGLAAGNATAKLDGYFI